MCMCLPPTCSIQACGGKQEGGVYAQPAAQDFGTRVTLAVPQPGGGGTVARQRDGSLATHLLLLDYFSCSFSHLFIY